MRETRRGWVYPHGKPLSLSSLSILFPLFHPFLLVLYYTICANPRDDSGSFSSLSRVFHVLPNSYSPLAPKALLDLPSNDRSLIPVSLLTLHVSLDGSSLLITGLSSPSTDSPCTVSLSLSLLPLHLISPVASLFVRSFTLSSSHSSKSFFHFLSPSSSSSSTFIVLLRFFIHYICSGKGFNGDFSAAPSAYGSCSCSGIQDIMISESRSYSGHKLYR